MATDIDKFVHDQLSLWPSVAAKYRALKSARTRTLPYGGILVTLQSNPGRLPIFDHGCPLCEENYMEHQHTLPFEGRKGRKYNILVNRAPIFPNHLVITRDIHAPQTIWHRFPDMLDLATQMEGYVVFYNSPRCGTSVPQHAHFQACPKGYMPLERATERLLRIQASGQDTPEELEFITSVRDARLYHYKRFNRGIFMLRATTSKSMAKLFYRLLDCLNLEAEGEEPRFNAFAYTSEGEFRAAVVVRSGALPRCNFAEGPDHVSISPGAADMAGFMVIPEADDFDRITPEIIRGIYEDITLTEEEEKRLLWRLIRSQPRVEVGLLHAPRIRFEIISDGAGPQEVTYREGKIDYGGALYDELVFEAATISTLFAEPSFILYKEGETLRFAGTLKFMVEKGQVAAIGIVGAEDYLLSVISNMPGPGRKEKAIGARTRLMQTLKERESAQIKIGGPALDNTPEVVTYLEHRPASAPRPSRKNYDVSAEDPLYKGLGPAADIAARQVIDETWGKVLE